jgi:hypothetical protein
MDGATFVGFDAVTSISSLSISKSLSLSSFTSTSLGNGGITSIEGVLQLDTLPKLTSFHKFSNLTSLGQLTLVNLVILYHHCSVASISTRVVSNDDGYDHDTYT